MVVLKFTTMRNVHPHTSKTKRRSILFFEIGLICALSFALWAFNITSTSDIVVINPPEPTTVIEDQMLGKIEIVPDELVEILKTTSQPSEQFRIVKNETPIPEPIAPAEPIIPISQDLGKIKIILPPTASSAKPIEAPEVWAAKMPSFPGGQEAMMDFIQKNVKYPGLAIENLIQGRVTVMFVVEKNGEITNIEVVKSVGWGLDDEAIRVVKSMPRWIPGENNYRPVRVKIALPIKFILG